MRWILASASPRRSELLRQIGLRFEILPSEADENIERETPNLLVEALSGKKCLATAEKIQDHSLVLGADTVVSLDGRILGKPGTEEKAEEMLKLLSGREHQVCTGVTMAEVREGRVLRSVTFSETTNVFFYPISSKEIREYVLTGDPMDKAGAYGIQGSFAKFVRGIQGDYNNVVGLPAARVYQELKKMFPEEFSAGEEGGAKC